MIRRLILFACWALAWLGCACPTVSLAAGGNSDTADWLQANAARLNGKPQSLRVSGANPGRVEGQYQSFWVWTDAGGISVRILHKDAPAFLSRYQKGDERARLDGIVCIDDGFVHFDPTGEEVTAEVAKEPETKVRIWTALDGRTVEAESFASTTANAHRCAVSVTVSFSNTTLRTSASPIATGLRSNEQSGPR